LFCISGTPNFFFLFLFPPFCGFSHRLDFFFLLFPPTIFRPLDKGVISLVFSSIVTVLNLCLLLAFSVFSSVPTPPFGFLALTELCASLQRVPYTVFFSSLFTPFCRLRLHFNTFSALFPSLPLPPSPSSPPFPLSPSTPSDCLISPLPQLVFCPPFPS